VVGTRGSKLALVQTKEVINKLKSFLPELKIKEKIIKTAGEVALGRALPLIGGKGLFTEELEEALRNKEIDFAVHSLKDLPTKPAAGLIIAAILERETARDVLVFNREEIANRVQLAEKALHVGTSSLRRESQLRKLNSHLIFSDIRGNIDTRVSKVERGQYDVTILAEAGLKRAGIVPRFYFKLELDEMMPAPGQGAMAVEVRSDDSELIAWMEKINHLRTFLAVTAERGFLAELEAGCSTPLAAYASFDQDTLTLAVRCVSRSGRKVFDKKFSDRCTSLIQAQTLGQQAAFYARDNGILNLV
jgi:hydroxymethylbilane synthase